jgi:hypothetical protein
VLAPDEKNRELAGSTGPSWPELPATATFSTDILQEKNLNCGSRDNVSSRRHIIHVK